jgi:hypothetical protein
VPALMRQRRTLGCVVALSDGNPRSAAGVILSMMFRRCFALTVALAVLLVCCSSGSGKRSTHGRTPMPTTSVAVQSSTRLPHGWKRFSYGSLRVGAPATWKVSTARPPNCGSAPSKTVSEYTVTTVEFSSCPGVRVDTSDPAVSIQCLRGAADGLFSGSATTTVVDGATLHHSGRFVWLQGRGWEGVVILPNNASLSRAMLPTVEPSGSPC